MDGLLTPVERRLSTKTSCFSERTLLPEEAHGADPAGEDEHHQHHAHALSRQAHDDEDQHLLREAAEDLADKHEDLVDHTAEIGGDTSQYRAEEVGAQRADQADGNGDLAAVEQAGEDVAAALVAAEDMLAGGRLIAEGHIKVVGIPGSKQRRGGAEQYHCQKEEQPEHGQAVLHQLLQSPPVE